MMPHSEQVELIHLNYPSEGNWMDRRSGRVYGCGPKLIWSGAKVQPEEPFSFVTALFMVEIRLLMECWIFNRYFLSYLACSA